MPFYEAVGIDVSKHTIDAVVHSSQQHRQLKNSPEGFRQLLKWVDKSTSTPADQRIYALEHTGIYSLQLSSFLSENGMPYILISGLELKRSLGLVRGKDDKVDAAAIALYAYRRREELIPYQLPSKMLLKLRRLLSLRDKLVRQRAGFASASKETKSCLPKKDNELFFEVHEQLVKVLGQKIKRVEQELMAVVMSDEEMHKAYLLVTSIKGVGPVTAQFMVAYTACFTLFDDARKFASYAGVAPFPNQSGISIRGRTKVSHLANKRFKALLSNCATVAIQRNPEIRLYYQRRIKEGKSKMNTINIIRNKLLARIFAVVKRGTPYVDTHAFAA